MLDLLVSGKTRLKLLTKFFLAPEIHGHLRGLAEEFGESTNAIRLELNRFEQGGLLIAEKEQNRKVYRANQKHPLYLDISNLLRKHLGIDGLVENVINKLGNVSQAYLTGEMAQGRDSKQINLLLVADEINEENLQRLVSKAEALIHRKIIYTVIPTSELNAGIEGMKDVWKIWGR